MLEKLIVTNFAIIEDLTVDFNDKMTVLTGETGAGKSLIIDTISLLLGARADSDMIRYEKNMASITGIFSSNDYLNEVLNKYQIPIMDKITILREIYDSSKNVVKINNHSVNLVTLKNIAVYLALFPPFECPTTVILSKFCLSTNANALLCCSVSAL